MIPNQGNPSSNWFLKSVNSVPGNNYNLHNKKEYLTPGQIGYNGNNSFGFKKNFKENHFGDNWNLKSNNNINNLKFVNEGGFRSNTGQYNNSNENHAGPKFGNLKDQNKFRYSYFEREEDLEMKIKEQDLEFSRMSNVNENFKLQYIEYNFLPHISQLNLAVSK